VIDRTKLGTYFDIFMNVVNQPRCSITTIAKNIGHTGRGRRRATISEYLKHMYESGISLKPNLFLKDYDDPQRKAYLCRKNSRHKIGETFKLLREDRKVTYIAFISGLCDYFLTSRDPALDLSTYDLEVVESSILYSPIFTIPQGWHLPFDKAAQNILGYQFEEGNLERESYGILDWKELDMRIFDSMRENVRRPFTEVSGITGVFSSTVKEHFYKHVLPRCNVAHYFFPKGYDFYMKNLIRIHTKCEKSIVNALKCLPCTTYVYPLEKGLIITLFHENINITMTLIEKMEENGVIEHYTLFTPLWYDHI